MAYSEPSTPFEYPEFDPPDPKQELPDTAAAISILLAEITRIISGSRTRELPRKIKAKAVALRFMCVAMITGHIVTSQSKLAEKFNCSGAHVSKTCTRIRRELGLAA